MNGMKSGIMTGGGPPGNASGGCRDECCCPVVVVYVVFTRCLTINNCAQEDWEFCED